MKVTLESTTRIVAIQMGRSELQARVWEGETGNGIKVVALIAQVAADQDADLQEFERDLQERRPPSAAAECFPLRMIL